MKKLLLFAVVLFITNSAFSQIVLSDTLGVGNYYADTDTIGLPVEEDVFFRIHTNNASAVNCVLEVVDIDIPTGTSFEICIEDGACITDIDEIMQVGDEFPVTDSVNIHFTYMTYGITGDAFIKLKVSNRGDASDNALISYDTEKYVAINDYAQQLSVEIYPNPVAEILNINFSEINQDFISIYDVNGKLIEKINIKTNSQSINLNVSNYEQGIYFVKIGNQSKKFVKK